MKKTRMSLYYLAGYLLTGGLGFLLIPGLALKIFLSSGNYSHVMVRLVGVMLLSLGIVIVQLIRLHAEELYPTTLVVRVFIITCLVIFYVSTRDPMMLILTGIVLLGFILTLSAYLHDRKGR